MNRRLPSHLRLHVEDSSQSQPAELSSIVREDEVAACLKTFVEVTGWAVRSTATKSSSMDGATPSSMPRSRTQAGIGQRQGATTPSRWRLVDASPMDGILSASDLAHFPTVTLEHAEQLLGTIESLVDRLERAEEALRRQEAELATNVSVTRGPNEQKELADRIEAILASATKSIGATASAVYLLDETTSHLKMRATWGLPTSRLTEPPRELRGSLADLEALLGNAVLLEDTRLMSEWPTPEDFPSALVVPIGSSTMPHGTIWFWSNAPRKHSLPEIEIANLAAGRVMSELEQTLLGAEAKQAKKLRKQLHAAGDAQAARLPIAQPLHSDFQLGGWTFQGDAMGGGFHDWELNPQEQIVAAVGSAVQGGPQGALVATTIQSSIRTLWPTLHSPSQILRQASDLLVGIDDPSWSASAALFQINPETGYGNMAMAGGVQAFIISPRGFRPIGIPSPRLAQQVDPLYQNHRFVLQNGEVLVAFSDTVILPADLPDPRHGRNRKAQSKALSQCEILQNVQKMLEESAEEIAASLARMLPSFAKSDDLVGDRSLIVLRNTRRSK